VTSDTEKTIGVIALMFAFIAAFTNLFKKVEAVTPDIAPTLDTERRAVDPLFTGTGKVSLVDIYKDWAQRTGLDWRLLMAIATVESGQDPNAKNLLDPSYGLMQVLCRANCHTCPCTNKLNVIGWDLATPEKLFEPDFNVQIASQILQWNIENYGFNRGIAVYNRWASRLDPPDGPYGNQGYVDKVLREYGAIKEVLSP